MKTAKNKILDMNDTHIIKRGKCFCGRDAYVTIHQWVDEKSTWGRCLEHVNMIRDDILETDDDEDDE